MLTTAQQAQLDALLTLRLERRSTPLAWLRQPAGKSAPATILKLIERLTFIRGIGIDSLLVQQLHHNRILQLAREGGRYSPIFLQRIAKRSPRWAFITVVCPLRSTRITGHGLD